MHKLKILLYIILTFSIFADSDKVIKWPTKNKENFLKVIKEINTDNYDVLDIVEGDFNNDGLLDYVIAFGDRDEFFYEKVSFIENHGSYYKYLRDCENGIGWTYSISYIKLDSSSNNYLEIGITNGFSGSGYILYELTKEGPKEISFGFPATGMGSRCLEDINNDGKLERVSYCRAGQSQYRYLIYYSEWNGEEFGDEKFYEVEYGNEEEGFLYPINPNDVIINYIEANHYDLKNELKELSYDDIIPFEFNCLELDLLYDSIDISVVQKNNNEIILVAKLENEDQKEKQFFKLKKVKNKWKVYSVGKTLNNMKKN